MPNYFTSGTKAKPPFFGSKLPSIYKKFDDSFMARVGLVIFFVAILASVGIAIYVFTMFNTNFVYVNEGEKVQIGPIVYVIQYEGQFGGDKETIPEHSFFKIRINAQNVGNEPSKITGGQFYIIDENNQKTQPVYGKFSKEDLLTYELQPQETQTWTTQFDVPFDDTKQYKIGIRATKDQNSMDIGIICMLNC